MPPEQRRAAIIEAVRPLLIEHGQAVTVRQIAAAAGVAEGTIFGVFADKDELIAAVVEHVVNIESFEQAVSGIDRQAPFEERLVSVTELLQSSVVDVWQVLSSIGGKHRAKHSRGMPESQAMIELLAVEPERFRVDPVRAARMLQGLTLSLSHPMLATKPASATEIVDMLLHGAGAPSQEKAARQ
jgi:AcrR family transcriptional regulator